MPIINNPFNDLLKMSNSTSNNGDNINIISTALGSLLTTIVSKQYKLDMTMYGTILPIMNYLSKIILTSDLNIFHKINIPFNIYTRCFGLFIACLLIFIFRNKLQNILEKILGREYDQLKVYDNLYNNNLIHTFLRYVKKYNLFYDKVTKYEIEESNGRYKDHAISDIKIKFNDKNFNITGYYLFTTIIEETRTDNNVKKNIIDVLNIFIKNNSKFDVRTYFQKITEKIYEDDITSDMKLYHIKILTPRKTQENENQHVINSDIIYYNGPRKDIKVLEEQYIDTFFHPMKQKLWTTIKSIDTRPELFTKIGQSPQIGLLLYGPPGTGKSNFAFRIAATLQRHVISVDILTLKTKESIYQIMKRPNFGGRSRSPKDVVYIFDEFDITVLALYNKEIQKKKKQEAYYSMMLSMTNPLLTPTFNIQSPVTSTITTCNTNTSTNTNNSQSTETNKNPIKSESENEVIVSDISQSDEKLSLTDLLEILQGPVPTEGSIIIATTNRFEEIKKICPALVRSGRLTPIEFGYPIGETVNEVSQKYFGKRVISDNSYQFNICMATIMEYIIDSTMDPKKGFNYFKSCINNHVSK